MTAAETSSSTLHLTSGDAIAAALRESTIAGRIEPVREALVDGPLPVGAIDESWEDTRARWLASRYGLDLDESRAEQARLTTLIDDAARCDDLVVWFDADLYCQRTLLMVLHRIAVRLEHTEPRIRVASLEQGEAPAALVNARELSSTELTMAADAWHVIAAQDAAEIAATGGRLADQGFAQLADALQLELRWRLLRVRSRGEVARLAGVQGSRFNELFAAWNERHGSIGLGDWQVWLLAAAAAQRDAVTIEGAEPVPAALHDGSFRDARITAIQGAT